MGGRRGKLCNQETTFRRYPYHRTYEAEGASFRQTIPPSNDLFNLRVGVALGIGGKFWHFSIFF